MTSWYRSLRSDIGLPEHARGRGEAPPTSASMSSRVLYIASDARAVAGTPKRSITGWRSDGRCGWRRPPGRRWCRRRAGARPRARTTGCSPCAARCRSAGARDLEQRRGAVVQQIALVRARSLAGRRRDVVERRAEPDRAGDVRACPPRTCTAARSRSSSRTSPSGSCRRRPERRHRLEQRLAAVQHADAGRAVQLVPGRHVEIAVERLHVDRQVIRRLRRRRPAPARPRACASSTIVATGLMVPSAFDMWVTDSSFVRGVSSALELVEQQLAAIVDRRDPQVRAASPRTAAATGRCWSGAPSPR